MSDVVWTAVTQLVLGGALFVLGWWGRRNAAELVAESGAKPTAESRQVGVIRRGGLACQVVGSFLAVLTMWSLL